MPLVLRALGVLALLAPALAAPVTLRLTSPPEVLARPGELVTHVFRLEGSGGPYLPSFEGGGFPVLSRPRPVSPPGFVAVTVRVPPGAREGTEDRVVVRVDGASAEARVRVAFAPGFELDVPREVVIRGSRVRVPIALRNVGNGPDRFRVALVRGRQVVAERDQGLGPGEEIELFFLVEEAGAYRVEVREQRGGLTEGRTLLVRRPRRGGLAPLELIGEAKAGYSYPSGEATLGLGIGGPLSDYLGSDLAFSLSNRSPPRFSLKLLGKDWRSGVRYEDDWELFLGLGERAVRVDLGYQAATGEVTSELSTSAPGQAHRLGLEFNRHYRFHATGRGQLALGAGYFYRAEWWPAAGDYAGVLGLSRSLAGGLWRAVYQVWGAEGEAPRHRVSLGTSRGEFSAGGSVEVSGLGVSDWSLAASVSHFGVSLDPHRVAAAFWWPGALGEVSYGLGPGFEAWGRVRLPLPPPGDYLRLAGDYRDGALSLAAEARGRFRWESQVVSVEARLAYPWAGSRLGAGVRYTAAGGERIGLELVARPVSPYLEARARAEAELGPLGLGLEAYYRWPTAELGVRLAATHALSLPVSDEVARLFGGRRAATIVGELETDYPVPDLSGVRVVAGPAEAETDAAGRFELRLPPGRYRVRVDPASLPPSLVPVRGEVEVTLAEKQTVRVTLRLAVRGRISGRVELAGEGELPRCLVEVINPEGERLLVAVSPDGRFSLPGVRPGRYLVRVAEGSLPPGYVPVGTGVSVVVEPGETAVVELRVKPPERRVYREAPRVFVLAVEPEARSVPPGSRPLVTARLRGEAAEVLVSYRDEVLGRLAPTGEEGVWRGRVAVPEDARGTLPLLLVVRDGAGGSRSFPFFLQVSEQAPWGVIRTLPVARPGRPLPLAVHLYAPALGAWAELGGAEVALDGEGADWKGRVEVPPDAEGRLTLRVRARLAGGGEVVLERSVLVKR